MQDKPPTRPIDSQALAALKAAAAAESSRAADQHEPAEPAVPKPPPTVVWHKRPARRVLHLPIRP